MSSPPQTWDQLVDAAGADEALAAKLEGVLTQARASAALQPIKRVFHYEEVGEHRTWHDGRAHSLEPEIQQTFALAMTDFAAASALSTELPLLAAAHRLTGEAAFAERLLEQLSELVTWSPLQRPGWSCCARGERLPPGGKDGNWLGTGIAIRTVSTLFEILPADGVIDASLKGRLHELLALEIADIVDDWKLQRPWFVQTRNAVTNQWVLPTEGLIHACLLLGRDNFEEAYELGVSNMLQAMSIHGNAGEFEEGHGYASFTVRSMLAAARSMALADDRRAIDHPFLRHFPDWLVQHLQPARHAINCFDAGGAYLPRDGGFRDMLAILVVYLQSPVAQWALENQFDGAGDDFIGLLAAAAGPTIDAKEDPPTYAAYAAATRVNWRSSWDDDATGVWIRGGHPLDQHDHQDRGHVNLIWRGTPILIEAGGCSYDNDERLRLYKSGVGHNVLQIGTTMPPTPPSGAAMEPVPGWQLAFSKGEGTSVPIDVHALNPGSGRVSLDSVPQYERLHSWRRTVTWSDRELVVEDEVALLPGEGDDIILFRWHLATKGEVALEADQQSATARWDKATLKLSADCPIEVTQVQLPDVTLWRPDRTEAGDATHTCLVVQTTQPVSRLSLTTEVHP